MEIFFMVLMLFLGLIITTVMMELIHPIAFWLGLFMTVFGIDVAHTKIEQHSTYTLVKEVCGVGQKTKTNRGSTGNRARINGVEQDMVFKAATRYQFIKRKVPGIYERENFLGKDRRIYYATPFPLCD
jgi:hypothetical protein